MLQTFFWYPSPDMCLSQSSLRAPRTIPSTSLLGFCSDMHAGTLYRQMCAFPNHVQSFEFTTSGLQSSCRNISRMINGNRMHLSSILSLIAKSEYLCRQKNSFQVFIMGIVLRLMRKNMYLIHFRIRL